MHQMSNSEYVSESNCLIESRLAQLKQLSFDQASNLPEASQEEVTLAGQVSDLGIFAQRRPAGDLLVTVQLARRGSLGLVSFHTERGLLFSNECIREATSEELMESGG